MLSPGCLWSGFPGVATFHYVLQPWKVQRTAKATTSAFPTADPVEQGGIRLPGPRSACPIPEEIRQVESGCTVGSLGVELGNRRPLTSSPHPRRLSSASRRETWAMQS